jgi:hypothetical protein
MGQNGAGLVAALLHPAEDLCSLQLHRGCGPSGDGTCVVQPFRLAACGQHGLTAKRTLRQRPGSGS